MKARHLLSIAITIVAFRLALRTVGADAHASVISGMPLSPASLVLGPLVVLAWLAASILAPVLAVAAATVALLDRLRARGERRR
jgi:hypothetical protein